MMPAASFLELFSDSKPILGMIHLKGETPAEKLSLAKWEIDIMLQHGIDAIIVENYFGTPEDMESVLSYIVQERPHMIYGVNVLDDDARGFAMARQYRARFIQLDSVAGHLLPGDDPSFADFIRMERNRTPAFVLGGVRFKYQPYLSGRSLKEDLIYGLERSDAIVVTGDATGQATDVEKIRVFREHLGPFPLIVGAGLTADNCRERLSLADGGIIGSYLKNTHKDDGIVSPEHVGRFMDEVRKMRTT
jgi:hypothetical protein